MDLGTPGSSRAVCSRRNFRRSGDRCRHSDRSRRLDRSGFAGSRRRRNRRGMPRDRRRSQYRSPLEHAAGYGDNKGTGFVYAEKSRSCTWFSEVIAIRDIELPYITYISYTLYTD